MLFDLCKAFETSHKSDFFSPEVPIFLHVCATYYSILLYIYIVSRHSLSRIRFEFCTFVFRYIFILYIQEVLYTFYRDWLHNNEQDFLNIQYIQTSVAYLRSAAIKKSKTKFHCIKNKTDQSRY